jgi:YD repeat-containing protein
LATNPILNASQGVGVLTDGLSHATSYTLDNLGRMTKRVTADGAVQQWQLDFAGQPTKTTDALLNVTSFAYDYNTGKGDLTQITRADGSTEQFQYDGTFHHMTVRTDGKGNTTTMAYDATTGDLTTYTNALNQTSTYAYYQTGGRCQRSLQHHLMKAVKKGLGLPKAVTMRWSLALVAATAALRLPWAVILPPFSARRLDAGVAARCATWSRSCKQ